MCKFCYALLLLQCSWLEYCCQSCLKVDFNTLQANSSALRRITLHLALLHRVICLTGVLSSCDLPSLWLNLRSSFYASRSSSAQMCAEQDTPSLPWSCNVFCVVLDLWSRLLSLQFHTGGTKAEAKLFLSEAPKWYECFAEILRDLVSIHQLSVSFVSVTIFFFAQTASCRFLEPR